MALTNTQLCYYDSNVLRLPADKRKEYHAQVDRLIVELSKSIRGKTEIKITRVVKAGSFAKFTILRKTSVDPVDVDVVFYISGRSVDQGFYGLAIPGCLVAVVRRRAWGWLAAVLLTAVLAPDAFPVAAAARHRCACGMVVGCCCLRKASMKAMKASWPMTG